MTAAAVTAGEAMYRLIEELFPICRSITGPGIRETLRILQRESPLELHEVPSGTRVLDWVVPDEWTLQDAWITGPGGDRIVDLRDSALHVVGYSTPIRTRLTLGELQGHLHSIPSVPEAIPYRTAYFERDWGFCLSDHQRASLPDGEYDVCVDATLAPGSLAWGEMLVPGQTADEVLIAAHICHPSLANDNLSGMALAVALANWVREAPRRYSYRFLFHPGTIGAVAWLAGAGETIPGIVHGMVLSGVGDPGPITWKRSRRGGTAIDRAAAHVLHHAGAADRVRPFTPWGYAERQFCSPGFDLPVGCFMRTPWGEYPEYHTSDDNLDFVTPEALSDSFRAVTAILSVLEGDGIFRNLQPWGEPQLGRRGLYDRAIAGHDLASSREAMLWLLNQSDGTASLLDIAERSALPFTLIRDAADWLIEGGLLDAV